MKNCNLVIPQAFIKDAEATGEAFSPQKRTSSTSKHENSHKDAQKKKKVKKFCVLKCWMFSFEGWMRLR